MLINPDLTQHDDKMQPPLTLTSGIGSKDVAARLVVACRDCGEPIALESDWPICKDCHVTNPRASRDTERDIVVRMDPKSRTATVIVTREAWDALLARVTALEDRVATLEAENINQQRQIVALKHDFVVDPD